VISRELFHESQYEYGCGPLDATNASKHSIGQSEDRILQINQSKKCFEVIGQKTNNRVNSFMQSLLQKVLFYLCLRPMN